MVNDLIDKGLYKILEFTKLNVIIEIAYFKL